MLLHQPQEVHQQQEENMSNLTSASGDQASVSSGNITEASGSNYFPQHQQQQEQQQQFFVPDSQPQKKRRNQPGNPGSCEKKKEFLFFWTDSLFQLFDTVIILEIMGLLPKRIFFLPFLFSFSSLF